MSNEFEHLNNLLSILNVHIKKLKDECNDVPSWTVMNYTKEENKEDIIKLIQKDINEEISLCEDLAERATKKLVYAIEMGLIES